MRHVSIINLNANYFYLRFVYFKQNACIQL
jgi:hypothetical protein